MQIARYSQMAGNILSLAFRGGTLGGEPARVTEDGIETEKLEKSHINPYLKERMKCEWAKAQGEDRLYSRAFITVSRDGTPSVNWLEAAPVDCAPGQYRMNFCSYMTFTPVLSARDPSSHHLDKNSLSSADWKEHWGETGGKPERKWFTRAEVLQTVEKFERDYTVPAQGMSIPMPINGERVVPLKGPEPFAGLLAAPAPATP